MAGGGIGGLHGITALVHPGVDAKAIALAGAAHELPHPHGVGAAHGLARVPALDQREIAQVAGEALRAEAGADHRLEARAAAEEDLHPTAGRTLEVGEVVSDPRMVGVGEDVDVPADAARVERRDSASSGAASARSLRTTASAAELSWMSASRSTTGATESWIAADNGAAGGAGGSWLAQAASTTSGQSWNSRVMPGEVGM